MEPLPYEINAFNDHLKILLNEIIQHFNLLSIRSPLTNFSAYPDQADVEKIVHRKVTRCLADETIGTVL